MSKGFKFGHIEYWQGPIILSDSPIRSVVVRSDDVTSISSEEILANMFNMTLFLQGIEDVTVHPNTPKKYIS